MNTEQRREKLNELIATGIAIPARVWISLDASTPPTELREWQWHARLWDRPTRSGWPYNDHDLEHAQEVWDVSSDSSDFVKTRQEMAAERAQREATQQAARDAEYAAVRQVATDSLTAELRRSYLSQPGTSEASFEQALPVMLEQRARDAALSGTRAVQSPLSAREILS